MNIANDSNAGANLAVQITDRLFTEVPAILANASIKIQNAGWSGKEKSPLGEISVSMAAGAWTVRVVTALPAVGFMFCGLKLQFPPAGKPEHASPMICLNPFLGVSVIVKLPEDPCLTVMDDLLIDSE